jgi:hypothetical protein
VKTEIIAVDIIELGYLTLRTVGHNQHGAYVAIDDDNVEPPKRVAYFKFSDELVHYYEGDTPNTKHQKIIDIKISVWFKNSKNFNRAASAWNSMGLSPIIPLKGK